MDNGDGNHELTSRHALGTSNILTKVGRIYEMDSVDQTKIIPTTQSSHGTEQLTAEAEVILLKRRVEELELQLRGARRINPKL